MKKLSALIALITCVIIGGVYATWTYTSNNIFDKDDTIAITMGEAIATNAPGTFSVEANFSMQIEPLDEVDTETNKENANHIAAIKWVLNSGTQPQITFTFTPDADASVDIKANGPSAQFYFVTSAAEAGGSLMYESTKIFTLGKEGKGVVDNKDAIVWQKQLDGSFSCVIDATEYIKLTQDFVIDTHAKWESFNTAIRGNTIVVVITDGVTDTAQN